MFPPQVHLRTAGFQETNHFLYLEYIKLLGLEGRHEAALELSSELLAHSDALNAAAASCKETKSATQAAGMRHVELSGQLLELIQLQGRYLRALGRTEEAQQVLYHGIQANHQVLCVPGPGPMPQCTPQPPCLSAHPIPRASVHTPAPVPQCTPQPPCLSAHPSPRASVHTPAPVPQCTPQPPCLSAHPSPRASVHTPAPVPQCTPQSPCLSAHPSRCFSRSAGPAAPTATSTNIIPATAAW